MKFWLVKAWVALIFAALRVGYVAGKASKVAHRYDW